MARSPLLALLLTACGTGQSPSTPDASVECLAPEAPYPAIIYGTDTVTLTAADWQLVVEFRDRALNYFACAEGN